MNWAHTAPRPLKVQISIRDYWAKEDSSLQKSVRDLNELLGQTATIDPEWPQLLAELDKFYADKSSFVTAVAGCVQAWVKSLAEVLEDTEHEEWAETLVERTTAAGSRLRVFPEVGNHLSSHPRRSFGSGWRANT